MKDPERTPVAAKRADTWARGELEALIMDALWSHDDWLTPGAVVSLLEHQHPTTCTRATTSLVRLWDKGMIDRRAVGRDFAYHPMTSRDEWITERMHEVLDAAADSQPP